MDIHEGHRDRLKKLFMEQGLDCFDDYKVLELLLFYALPRRDTNPIAHELINRFDSLEAVFEAPADELAKVPGIGSGAITLIKLVPELSRRCAISKARPDKYIDSSEKAGTYLVPRYMLERDEVVYVICLDAANRLLCCKELFRGAANTTEISIRKIAELALAKNASGIIISHNHTSGIALPSAEDDATTKLLKETLNRIGIRLIDHIIVAGDDFISMADSGLL
ncbi:MAG: DNA repair protein RadC [Clostridiales bacterium]|jgi:DNA repair protein RadC|nr:DNA repair protein RadC [Clostridiales bacterium]